MIAGIILYSILISSGVDASRVKWLNEVELKGRSLQSQCAGAYYWKCIDTCPGCTLHHDEDGLCIQGTKVYSCKLAYPEEYGYGSVSAQYGQGLGAYGAGLYSGDEFTVDYTYTVDDVSGGKSMHDHPGPVFSEDPTPPGNHTNTEDSAHPVDPATGTPTHPGQPTGGAVPPLPAPTPLPAAPTHAVNSTTGGHSPRPSGSTPEPAPSDREGGSDQEVDTEGSSLFPEGSSLAPAEGPGGIDAVGAEGPLSGNASTREEKPLGAWVWVLVAVGVLILLIACCSLVCRPCGGPKPDVP